jgi:serine phosphatase RsbU (regulator of sigma subunit)
MFTDHESLDVLKRNLCEAVRIFAGKSPQEDDMTVVLVRRSAG